MTAYPLGMFQLAFEAQAVIALRLSKLALGGPAAMIEAGQMVSDKCFAAAEAATLVSSAVMSGTPDAGLSQVTHMLRRRVRANHRRLAK